MAHSETPSSTKPIRPAASKRKRRLLSQSAIMLALVLMISIYFTVMASAQCTYTITDGNSVTVHTSTSKDIAQVLQEAGIAVDETDLVTSSGSGPFTHIFIQRSQAVTVNYLDQQLSTNTHDTTVQDLLSNLDITLGADDIITAYGQPLSVNDAVYDGMSIHITNSSSETITETITIPYETVTYLDPTMAIGTSAVKTAGVEGQQETTYQKNYVNGTLVDTTVVSTKLLSAPVTEVILQGSAAAAPAEDETAVIVYTEPEESASPDQSETTLEVETDNDASYYDDEPEYEASEPGESDYEELEYEEPDYEEPDYEEPDYEEPSYSGDTITTSSGEVLTYTDVLSVEATAYCGGGTTATGTPARYGAIAVDPDVIPYGTRMYIVSDDGRWIYGEATAEDCGGAINGYIIDLYFDSYDTCIQFGRRDCTVYILEWG